MPVVFNEPLSFLQRVVEYMEYSSLIRRASDSMDPVERLEVSTVAYLHQKMNDDVGSRVIFHLGSYVHQWTYSDDDVTILMLHFQQILLYFVSHFEICSHR